MHKKLYGDYRRDIAGVIAEVARADGVDVDVSATVKRQRRAGAGDCIDPIVCSF